MFGRNYMKPGKGVSKEDLDKSGVALYFDIFFRRIWKLIKLNLLYLMVSIPALLIAFAASLYFINMMSVLAGVNIEKEAGTIIVIAILFAIAFFQFTGSGPASVAKNYVLRRYVRDTHSWVVSDFFDNFKSNFKQGLAIYFINTLVLIALIFAYIFYSSIWQNSAGGVLSVMIIIIAVVFVMMQMYVYQLTASVQLKTKYIYKNALALTIIKLPWNIVSLAMSGVLMYLLYYISMNIPLLGGLFVVLLYYVLMSFTQIFMTNNIMDKYVIEPSKEAEKEE